MCIIMKTKFIPHLMKRYAINENGEIFDDGIKLIPEFIDGLLKVKLIGCHESNIYRSVYCK